MINIYSMTGCANCDLAAKYLQHKGIPCTVIKVDEDEEAEAFFRKEGHRSVPQLYKDGELIPGGYQGLLKLPVEYLK